MALSQHVAPNNDDKPFLQLRHITKTFGHFVALSDISLDVYEGEFVCFLGPSGCGKTTLLRIIAGLEEQNTGQLIQNGVDISRFPPANRDFGIVFQSYALFPNMTAAKNIAYGLENQKIGKAKIKARVQELLELVGLPQEGPKYPSQLSGGQQQRIALARALALSPGLLLLDEPLSALDARVRASLREEVAQLQKRLGVTTIMVTHDQEEALTMADRIVVMDHGLIMQVGSPSEIYQGPTTPFVANFIGEMNFLSGVLTADPHKVQVGDFIITINDTLSIAPGKPLTVSIRPEDVQVRDVDPNSPDTLMTKIEHIEFLGSFYRLRLSVAKMTETIILADLSVHAARYVGIAAGADLPIQLPAAALQLFTTPPPNLES